VYIVILYVLYDDVCVYKSSQIFFSVLFNIQFYARDFEQVQVKTQVYQSDVKLDSTTRSQPKS